jgi:hypothetical protein
LRLPGLIVRGNKAGKFDLECRRGNRPHHLYAGAGSSVDPVLTVEKADAFSLQSPRATWQQIRLIHAGSWRSD